MDYPKEFQNAVKAVYPSSTEMHELLEQGNEFLGRYLDDSQGVISPTHIVDLLESGQSEQLLEEAKNLLARKDVYAQWLQLYQQQRNLS